MDNQELHSRLDQLHGELQQIESIDEKDREILQKLMTDIKKLVEGREADDVDAHARLGEGLKEGIERLEASHPRATMLMGQVIDALAKIGI